MKKTIIAVAIVLGVVCVLLTACKSKKGNDETATTLPESVSTTVEVFTEADSNQLYVTNKDGEHIPVTTGLDGSIEFAEDLITKTAEQVSREASSINDAKQNSTAPTGATAPAATSPQGQTTTQSSGVEIGTGDVLDEDRAAVINWD